MRLLLKGILSMVIASITAFSAFGQVRFVDSSGISQLPSIPFLPDPLVLDEGGRNIPVENREQWKQKREWIKQQYQHWISGSRPPAPANINVKVLSQTKEGDVVLRMVELRFGPGDAAKMTLELMLPPSGKPLPVFMTQWNHRGWAQVAVRRGYIGCVYAGADAKDDTRNYQQVFPGYDFATLMKRAWGASRVVDYLYQLAEVDTSRIALVGHSRNGKQSLMAAAFDERIKAVVSSSGGTGGESTFRWSDDRFTPGSFDRMVAHFPDWFSPRLPWFIGREGKLPVDQNSLMALIAPRGLMMVSAITEHEGNPWGVGESFKSVKKVYHFLGADSNIAILLRRGRHQHAARDAEDFIDFFDYVFGRSKAAPENRLYYVYSFDRWKRLSGESIDPLQFPVVKTGGYAAVSDQMSPAAYRDSIRKKIQWLLGETPPGVFAKGSLSALLTKNKNYPDDYLEEVIGEPGLKGIAKMTIGPYSPLGDDLWANLYFPSRGVRKNAVQGKLPLVIYLHKYAYATGYHREGAHSIRYLTDHGFAVLALDMMGFGTRIEEARHFYDRYPHWSVMGKMVSDVRNVISDACNRMPFIDSTQIYVTGYALGGTVALLTAALDDRVKGTAVVSAFSSFRTDNTGTEGISHYYDLHGLIPRLGFFAGHEDRIPVDFDDVLALIVPRPLLIIAPARDRDHHVEKVRALVDPVIDMYRRAGASGQISFEQPDTYNHFSDSLRKVVADWVASKKQSLSK